MGSRTTSTLKVERLFACICLVASVACANASEYPLLEKINKLDQQFRTVSHEFYRNKSNYSTLSSPRINDINQLKAFAESLMNRNDPIAAVQLLHTNEDTVFEYIDHPAVFTFVDILLQNNDWLMANKLLEAVNQLGDRSITATVRFSFAKYLAKRNEHEKTLAMLEGVFADLTDDDSAYAYILQGRALQQSYLHREASESYQRVSESSKYYEYAQLNAALAAIRQGWWTDAQLIIQKLTKQEGFDNRLEIANRVYLVLGYALLRHEFYRDARNAFRQIALDSRYTNRALLGIGLTATNQGDYVGAINALTILKQKKSTDLSVDESHLLIPFVYEKLGQDTTVSAGYTQAISYYQKRIAKLENDVDQYFNFDQTPYDIESGTIEVGNNRLNYGAAFPSAFIENYGLLKEIAKYAEHPKITRDIKELLFEYDATYQNIVAGLVLQRIAHVKSYLDQSRYGLASLYDKNKANESE